MAPRTRSTTSSPVKKTSIQPINMSDETYEPVNVLILPRHISPNVKILSLRHPCDGSEKRFIFCTENGLLELKKTTPPPTQPQSIIFAPIHSTQDTPASLELNETSFNSGYINKNAELLTATPFDLAFILLGKIAPQTITTKKTLFQPLEDLLDAPDSYDKSMAYILQNGYSLVREAMSRICDEVDAGDEQMYRYSEEKVLNLVLERAQKVAESGLPASLEERFVTRVLEAPMLSIKREETTVTIAVPQPPTTDESASQDENLESQSTTTSTTVSAVFSEASTTTTMLSVPEDNIPADIKHLQRVRTAFNFIGATCLPRFVSARLSMEISKQSSKINFQPLDEYLKHLVTMRAEAAASRSMTDFGRKRGLEEEEAAEERAEKKRKQEEEEKKKKANESRGVRDLKKVNVTGMKKMSDFFAKKPAAAKAKS